MAFFRWEGLETGPVGIEDHRCWSGRGEVRGVWYGCGKGGLGRRGGGAPAFPASFEKPIIEADGEAREGLDGFEVTVR